MIGYMIKISFTNWRASGHSDDDFSLGHNAQFENLRNLFDAELPGLIGYSVDLDEIKILFDSQANANRLVSSITNNAGLLSDMIRVERTAVLPDVFRNPYIIKDI